jgi:hypothetical protein
MGFVNEEMYDQLEESNQPENQERQMSEDDSYSGVGYNEEREPDAFRPNNELKVIQEYNEEKHLPIMARKDNWAMVSKSMLLAFWENKDYEDVFRHQNIIKLNNIMSKPKQKYTFKERAMNKQVEFFAYQNFKRGVGTDRFRHNERTLQSMMINQSISGTGSSPRRKGGSFMGSIASMFQ